MKIQKEVGTFYTIRKKRYQYQEVCRMDQLKKLGLRRRNSSLAKSAVRIGRDLDCRFVWSIGFYCPVRILYLGENYYNDSEIFTIHKVNQGSVATFTSQMFFYYLNRKISSWNFYKMFAKLIKFWTVKGPLDYTFCIVLIELLK